MLKRTFIQFSLVAAVTLSGLTALSQDNRKPERSQPNVNKINKVERTDVNETGGMENRMINSSDTLPFENGDAKVAIHAGEVLHLSLKGTKKFDVFIIDNTTQFFGNADFIAFDEAGAVIENGSEEFGPAVNTAIWYGYLQNLSRSAEISEIYVRVSLKESSDNFGDADKSMFISNAMSGTSTFILPVTRDTSSYRKYDSRAVAGKFHTGDDYYNSDLKVMASNCGVIVGRYSAADGRGLGNNIIIKHSMADGGTSYSLYGHLASFAANTDVGKSVARGQRIGTMGKTGAANDIVHLHYEQKRTGVLGNPLRYGTYSANSLIGYVPQWAGDRSATSATNYGYFKPSTGDYPAICSQ